MSRRRPNSIDLELVEGWRRPPGIFVIAEIGGEVGARIRELQQRYDPKLANALPPHLTIAGSSGVGPIVPDTTVEELRQRLAPICADTPPLDLAVDPPHRFMQTNIVVLPMDVHGPLREFHERIARSGLRFERVRHAFTPHITLSFYRTLEPQPLRQLLATRIEYPVRIDAIRLSLTDEPLPPRTLLELPLGDGLALAEAPART